MYLVIYRRLPKNQVSLIVVLSFMYGGGFLSSQIFPQIENHHRHQQAVMHLQNLTTFHSLSIIINVDNQNLIPLRRHEESTNIKLELVIQSPR